MIIKPLLSSSFMGTCSYCLKTEKKPEILFQEGIFGSQSKDIAKQFEAIKDENRNISKPVWHAAISFAYPDNDKITNELMIEIGKEYLNNMGFDNHQYVFIKHNDTKHKHFHIIANRIGFNKEVISDYYSKNRSASVSDKLEVKYNLTVARDQNRKSRGYDNTKEQAKEQIRQTLDYALNKAKVKSFDKLENILKSKNIEVLIRYHVNTGNPYGISFSLHDYKFKGTTIGKEYKLSAIEHKIFNNNTEIGLNQRNSV